MDSKNKVSNNGTPSWWVSLIPVITLVGLMALVIRFFGADALVGGSQVAMSSHQCLASTRFCTAHHPATRTSSPSTSKFFESAESAGTGTVDS